MASEPTRGPVVVRRHKHRDMTEYPCLHVVAADGGGERVILSKIDTSDSDLFANFDLIAAAFNASTAARDLGFDAIGAIEALPELLKAAREYANCQRINPDVRCHECDRDIHAALSAARKRGDA